MFSVYVYFFSFSHNKCVLLPSSLQILFKIMNFNSRIIINGCVTSIFTNPLLLRIEDTLILKYLLIELIISSELSPPVESWIKLYQIIKNTDKYCQTIVPKGSINSHSYQQYDCNFRVFFTINKFLICQQTENRKIWRFSKFVFH